MVAVKSQTRIFVLALLTWTALLTSTTLLTSRVRAGVTDLRVQQSLADEVGAGYIANDILIDFEGNLRGQQLFLSLAAGEIYNNDSFGEDTAPNPFLFELVPDLKFDSFVTIGGLTSDQSEDVLIVGGAVDIPGAPSDKVFGPQIVSIAWAPASGINIPSGSDFPTARITWSSDASGNLWYFGSTSGTAPPLLVSRPFIGGIIGPKIIHHIFPEPTSLVLVALATFGLLTVRRRSQGDKEIYRFS